MVSIDGSIVQFLRNRLGKDLQPITILYIEMKTIVKEGSILKVSLFHCHKEPRRFITIELSHHYWNSKLHLAAKLWRFYLSVVYRKFQLSHSTETAMVRVLNDHQDAVDRDGGAILVLLVLDLSTAFDALDLSKILHTLESHTGVTDAKECITRVLCSLLTQPWSGSHHI